MQQSVFVYNQPNWFPITLPLHNQHVIFINCVSHRRFPFKYSFGIASVWITVRLDFGLFDDLWPRFMRCLEVERFSFMVLLPSEAFSLQRMNGWNEWNGWTWTTLMPRSDRVLEIPKPLKKPISNQKNMTRGSSPRTTSRIRFNCPWSFSQFHLELSKRSSHRLGLSLQPKDYVRNVFRQEFTLSYCKEEDKECILNYRGTISHFASIFCFLYFLLLLSPDVRPSKHLRT